jgi:hypothetical protein
LTLPVLRCEPQELSLPLLSFHTHARTRARAHTHTLIECVLLLRERDIYHLCL